MAGRLHIRTTSMCTRACPWQVPLPLTVCDSDSDSETLTGRYEMALPHCYRCLCLFLNAASDADMFFQGSRDPKPVVRNRTFSSNPHYDADEGGRKGALKAMWPRLRKLRRGMTKR